MHIYTCIYECMYACVHVCITIITKEKVKNLGEGDRMNQREEER